MDQKMANIEITEQVLSSRKDTMWVCKCGKSYTSSPSLYQHMKKKHPLMEFTTKQFNHHTDTQKSSRGRPVKFVVRNRIEQILCEVSDEEKYYLRKIHLPYKVDQQFEGDQSLDIFMEENGQNQEIKHFINHFCWEIKQAVFSTNIVLLSWAKDFTQFPLFANYISQHWSHTSTGVVRVEILNKIFEVYCRWLFEKQWTDIRMNLEQMWDREGKQRKKMQKNEKTGQQEKNMRNGEEIDKYFSQFD